MAKKRSVDLVPPVGGLNRRFGFQQQAPFTTNSAENVRTQDPFDGRDRIGSRPGLVATFAPFTDDRINMIGSVTHIPLGDEIVDPNDIVQHERFNNNNPNMVWQPWGFAPDRRIQSDPGPQFPGRDGEPFFGTDSSTSDMMSGYAASVWYLFSLNLIGTWRNSVGAVSKGVFGELTGEADLSTTPYSMSFVIGADFDQALQELYFPENAVYSFYFGMDEVDAIGFGSESNVGPDLAKSFRANSGYALHIRPKMTNFGDTMQYAIDLVEYTGGGNFNPIITQPLNVSFPVSARYSRFKLLVTPGDRNASPVTVGKMELTVEDLELGTPPADLGSSAVLSVDDGIGEWFGYNLIIPDDFPGALSDHPLLRLGQITFQTHGGETTRPKAVGSPVRTIVVAAGNTLYRHPNPRGLRTGSFEPVSNNLLPQGKPLTPSVFCASAEFFQKLYIIHPNEVDEEWSGQLLEYDPGTDTLDVAESSTEIPIPMWNNSIARFLGRLYLAGDKDAPHLWYASRQGILEGASPGLDFFFDSDSDDPRAGVAAQTSDTGTIGEPIVSMVPTAEDYMVFGAKSSLWVLRGDPRQSGRLDVVSSEIGFSSRGAWCFSPQMVLFFLSPNGLFAIPPGAGGYPQSVSSRNVPRELLQDDSATRRVIMAYDIKRDGINIFVSSGADRSLEVWWYDIKNDAFWPEKLSDTVSAKSVTAKLSTDAEFVPDGSNNLFGFADGTLRHHRDGAIGDGGEPFTSFVAYGPIRMGISGRHDGLIQSMQAKLPEGSGQVDWALLVGDSATAALTAFEPEASGRWFPGRNLPDVVRVRGNSAYLVLSSDQPWSVEEITLWMQSGGIQRQEKISRITA